MMTTGSHGQNVTAAPPDPQSKLQTDRQGQSSAEENIGQIDTHSGGAPASSPQGDTPAGMQPIPSGSDPPRSEKIGASKATTVAKEGEGDRGDRRR